MLQMANTDTKVDIQNLFKETIADSWRTDLKAKRNNGLVHGGSVHKNKGTNKKTDILPL